MRDPNVAQLHVLVAEQGTAAGGRAFLLRFIGREEFAGVEHELSYTSNRSDTEDVERRGLNRVLTMGLMPFVSQTPMASQIEFAFEEARTEATRVPEYDPWNNWVFHVD